jgi:hypothetical protein
MPPWLVVRQLQWPEYFVRLHGTVRSTPSLCRLDAHFSHPASWIGLFLMKRAPFTMAVLFDLLLYSVLYIREIPTARTQKNIQKYAVELLFHACKDRCSNHESMYNWINLRTRTQLLGRQCTRLLYEYDIRHRLLSWDLGLTHHLSFSVLPSTDCSLPI